eukprot:83578-Pyramimonas_sp.AAC.1
MFKEIAHEVYVSEEARAREAETRMASKPAAEKATRGAGDSGGDSGSDSDSDSQGIGNALGLGGYDSGKPPHLYRPRCPLWHGGIGTPGVRA